MYHLFKILIIILGMNILVDIAGAQEEVESGATVKGEVIEAGTDMNPIPEVLVKIVNSDNGNEYTVHTNDKGKFERTSLPAGRYTISLSKEGYGDRIGKSKVVAPGGEMFVRFKMLKKRTIVTYLKANPVPWILLVCFAFGLLVVFILLLLNIRK